MMPGAVVVLAAGASRRLGRPKQLVPWEGTTLVRHAVETALVARVGSIHLVVGAHAEEVVLEVSGLDVTIVPCMRWSEGMGASLQCGLSSLDRRVRHALVCVCDQPLVTPEHLRSLVDAMYARRVPIAASVYADRIGVPAVLSREVWPEVSPTGDQGARELLRRDPFRVARLEFPLGVVDVDTPEDVERLRSSSHDRRSAHIEPASP